MSRLVELMGIVTYTQKMLGIMINRKATKVTEKVVVDACPVCKEQVPSNYILSCGHGYCSTCINATQVPNTANQYRCGVCRHNSHGYVRALNIHEEMQVD